MVTKLHDLHVWSMSFGSPALSVHLVTSSEEAATGRSAQELLHQATEVCAKYSIKHTTIQIEGPDADLDCHCSVQHSSSMGDACTTDGTTDSPSAPHTTAHV